MASIPPSAAPCFEPRGEASALGRSPMVSVVVPTCNRAHLVGRALRSVLAQTVSDFEVFAVDDGSTDNTADVLAAIDDRRMRTVRLEENGGVSRARNTAIALARGEWMAFLDDDNEWAPNYLERQLDLAVSRAGADVVYCRAWRLNERTGQDGLLPLVIREGPVFRHLVNRWQPPTSCTMVRRSRLIEIGGFDEGLRVAEDYDLWLRLAQHTDFAGTAEILVVRYEHSGEHLFRNTELHARAVAVLERRWEPAIKARCGRTAYRRWRARLFANLAFSRVVQAVEARRYLEAAHSAARMAWLLPWSAAYLARVLAFTILGPRAYGRLAARRQRLVRK